MKNRMKLGVLVSVVVILAALNIYEYSADDVIRRAPANTKVAAPLAIPGALTGVENYEFSRNIFSRIEINQSPAPTEPVAVEKKAVPKPPPEKPQAVSEMSPDIEVVGIAQRSNRTMALVEFEGKTHFVSVGDRLGNRYIISKIEKSSVYVSSQ